MSTERAGAVSRSIALSGREAEDQAHIDSLLSLSWVAGTLDPLHLYQFPHADEAPEALDDYLYANYSMFLADLHYVVRVLHIAPAGGDGSDAAAFATPPIGFAVWKRPVRETFVGEEGQVNGTTPAARLDSLVDHFATYARQFREVSNPERLIAAFRATREAEQTMFIDRYGDAVLQLVELYVHPDHMHQGYGSMLLRWGKDRARQRGHHLATFAYRDTVGFYWSHGFRSIGSFSVLVPGEEEVVWLWAMVIDARDWARIPA